MVARLRWVVVLLVFAGFGWAWADEAVSVQVLSDDGRRTVLEFRINSFEVRPAPALGPEYVEIVLPGEALELTAGVPALPHVTRSVIIPDDSAVEVVTLASSFHDTLTRVAPSKGRLTWNDDPARIPYRFGAAYQTDAFFPGKVVSLGAPYIQRDFRGTTVRIDPFQFNPVTGILRVFDKVTVEVRPSGPGSLNTLKRAGSATRPIRAFEGIYGARFLNYSSRKSSAFLYPPVGEEGEFLIIAHDPWIPNLDPLVTHKRNQGFTVTVTGVSTIGNSWSQIKQYIKDFYNSHNLGFVLLVGDAAQVAPPPRTVGSEDGAGDPIYSELAGSDKYPDILVGRFSAKTADQVDTQVQRTVDYETLPGPSQDWYRRASGVASTDAGPGAGDDDQTGVEHIDEFRPWYIENGYDSVDKLYEPTATTKDVANALNAGRGSVNYCGHGSWDGWYSVPFKVSDVNALQNKDQLPFIHNVACNIGEFHHYDNCYCESWLRATKDGRPTGAVAIYGSSVSQYMAPPMEGQDAYAKLLTDASHPYHRFGALCFNGASSMIDKYEQDGIDMFETWILFGDPSLKVVGGVPPTGMRVKPTGGFSSTGPAGGPFSPASTTYTLENLNETPLEYQITAGQPWISLSTSQGTIPGKGNLPVTVSINDRARNMDIGLAGDTLTFTNLTDHQGDATRSVTLTIGTPIAAQQWTFDTDPGWSREGDWQFGQPTGQGGLPGKFNPDPTSGATGNNVFGVNLNGNFPGTVGGPYRLTSPPMNLTGIFGTTLQFQRWLNTAGPLYVTSEVEVSADGTNWKLIWSSPGPVADSAWSLQTLDISSVADNRPSVQVRWNYQVTSKVNNPGSGWNIDDIQIRGNLHSAKTALSVAKNQLTWSAIPGAAGYDVLRGDAIQLAQTAGDFTASAAECLGSSLPATNLGFTAAPASGGAWWFLVRGRTLSGPLTYQSLADSQVGARDEEIGASAHACP